MTAPPSLTIRAGLDGMTVPGRRYPRQLPTDLDSSHIYMMDGGHSIIVVLDDIMEREGGSIDDNLMPMPVRSVIGLGYRVDAGGIVHVRTDARKRIIYDMETGLSVPEEDEEF